MASSNIKLFDENKGNMLTDTEFNISAQRLNGLQTGVASSQLQNKAMYQASLVAYAIAQVMMQNGLNANDTDAVSTFVANLSGTMLQKVYDIATTAEAQAGVATGKWMSPALVKAAIDKTLSDNDFLKKSGDTMSGVLRFANTGGGPNVTEIIEWIDGLHIREKQDDNNYADLRLALYDLQLLGRNAGNSFSHIILHAGNAQALGFPKIAIGSYVGTGTYGSSNPNTLTFDFEPKIVFLSVDSSSSAFDYTGFMFFIRNQSGSPSWYFYNVSFVGRSITWSGNTLSWYTLAGVNDAPEKQQFNTSGQRYCYVALG